MCGTVYVRTATSNSLKALSHSFCPAACWVQSVISWLILSVTALKHTGSHTGFLALTCVLCMHAQPGFAHIHSHMLLAPLFKHGTAGPSLRWANVARRSAEIVLSLCSALQGLAMASIFLIRLREVSQAHSPAGSAAWLHSAWDTHSLKPAMPNRGIQMQQGDVL